MLLKFFFYNLIIQTEYIFKICSCHQNIKMDQKMNLLNNMIMKHICNVHYVQLLVELIKHNMQKHVILEIILQIG